ncbi:MAG: helicase C-terminal domain-containing protein [Acidobacteria bacterium]|nr:helicase C-terminal domain-containing protein [Acidobacteriota bacterium]
MTDDFDTTEVTEETVETAEEVSARDSIYGEIKRALISRGIPAEEIAFIHDYPTPALKAKVFTQVNAGKIRVLIGSTEKMGIGSNFQERLIALHHLSPCFRPADIQQREGRILRQGNIFPEVHICAYVTENSFDSFMWGLIESKARFISQIMAGEVTARTAEDVDQLVMTAAQIKAIASGNPHILEKVATEVELTKLERLYSAWSASRSRLRQQMETLPSHLTSIAREIAGHQKAIVTRDQNEPEKFTIVLRRGISSDESLTFTDRGHAGAHLRQLSFAVARESRSRGTITGTIGHYRGFEIIARASGRQLDALNTLFSEAHLFLSDGEGGLSYGFNLSESDIGIIQSMDAQLRGLEGKLEKLLATQAELKHRQRQIAVELNKGFEHTGRYEELRLRLNVLNQQLTESGADIEASPELSNLDEEAFRLVDPGFSIHQISSLAEQTVKTSEDNVVILSDQSPIVSKSHVVGSERVVAVEADLRLVQREDEPDQSCECVEVGSETKNRLIARPERDHSETATGTKRGAASKGAIAEGVSKQMAFDWS